jgi:hypothetical protein
LAQTLVRQLDENGGLGEKMQHGICPNSVAREKLVVDPAIIVALPCQQDCPFRGLQSRDNCVYESVRKAAWSSIRFKSLC